jgi:hypothetical protein
LFELKIWMPGQGAMRDLIRATSINEAVAFARNRYPKCEIEVPEEVVKPRLARHSPALGKNLSAGTDLLLRNRISQLPEWAV